MTAERWVARALVVLPFAYLLAVVAPAFPFGTVGVALGIGVALVVTVLFESPAYRPRDAGFAALSVLFATTAVALALPGAVHDAGWDLLAGIVLVAPVLFASVAWRSDEPLGFRLVGFGFAVLWGVAILAARELLSASGQAVTGVTFVGAFARANALQESGLAGLLLGTGYRSLPIGSAADPVFAALLAGALLGLLLATVRPQTGQGAPLPLAARVLRPVTDAPGRLARYGLSDAQREAFRARSTSAAPLTAWPPGIPALLVAAVATGVFLATSVAVPSGALLALALGMGAGAAAVVLLGDRLTVAPFLRGPSGLSTQPRGTSGRPGRNVPGAPSASSPAAPGSPPHAR